jgi:hypothetical protein
MRFNIKEFYDHIEQEGENIAVVIVIIAAEYCNAAA